MMITPGKKLRVGLLLDSFDLPAWAYCMLERIQQSNYAEIKLIVLNDTSRPERGLLQKIKENRSTLLYALYRKLEDRLFKPVPDAFAMRDAASLLVDIPVIKVSPIQKKFSDWIEDQDIEEIKKCSVDVFIRLGFRILRGKIHTASRYGIWSYHHGDNNVNRGGPAGFWEVLEAHPVTGSVLQIITEDLDNGLILYRSHAATDYLSVNRNLNNYFWKSLSFIPRKLEELHRLGAEAFFEQAKSENEPVSFYSSRLFVTPTNGLFLKAFIRHLLRYLLKKFDDLLFYNQWILLYSLQKERSGSFWRFKKIVPPKDRFWADPHVVFKDNRYFIFLEEFPYKENKGHISYLVIDEKGNYTAPKKVLERPYHLSYPFIFELEGEYYMIPDTFKNKTIEVYKCIEFPDQWEYHKTLMNGIVAVDSTLFFYEQKWWLFANVCENEGASTWDELFLFYSDHPLRGEWKSHPQNPVRSDVRNSRPAGRIFESHGNYYRPSQNCSNGYGYGLKINRIAKLSETEYREEEISSIEPHWKKNIIGVHTLNHHNRLTIIDGKLRRFRFS